MGAVSAALEGAVRQELGMSDNVPKAMLWQNRVLYSTTTEHNKPFLSVDGITLSA